MSLKQLKDEIVACTLCFGPEAPKRVSLPRGPNKPKVMFIGEGPSLRYTGVGVAFEPKGLSHPLLMKMIAELSLKKEECYFTNISKCSLPQKLVGDPEKCSGFLWKEIKLVDPEIIICLGRKASNHVFGAHVPLSGYCNKQLICREGDDAKECKWRVFCTLPHPMAVKRGTIKWGMMLKYIENVKERSMFSGEKKLG